MIRGHKTVVSKQLIAEVKKHPILYDQNHEHYKNVFVSTEAWIEIEKTIDINRTDCKKKWEGIKRSLFTCWRKNRKYYLEDDLDWYLPYIKGKTASSLTDFIAKLQVYHEYSHLSPSAKAEVNYKFSVLVTEQFYEMQKRNLKK